MPAVLGLHHLTVGDYDQVADLGLFDPAQHLELLDGEVTEMTPMGNRHAATVGRINHVLGEALRRRAVVWVQSTVRLGGGSAPEPDLTLLRWRPDFYFETPPTAADVLLVIEVSESSLYRDRSVKRPLYATLGVPELWIVDLVGRVIEVATTPGPDHYAAVRLLGRGDVLTPTALPDTAFLVDDLLPGT